MSFLKNSWITPDGHRIAYERMGKKGGLPVVFLHGGPGGRTAPHHTKLLLQRKTPFDAIFFDQRGCGDNQPSCDMQSNDTHLLINDMEALRKKEAIDQWLIVGGSWGATLALAYATLHPERVLGLILRSVFLGTEYEVEQAFRHHAKTFRPELWQQLKERLEERSRKKFIEDDVLNGWGQLIQTPDNDDDRSAAWIWHDYERILSDISTNQSLPSWGEVEKRRDYPRSPFLEWHYIKNQFFLKDIPILSHPPSSLELHIIAARYDLLCPPATSYRLAERWGDKAHIIFAETAGHHAQHKSVHKALCDTLDKQGKKILSLWR